VVRRTLAFERVKFVVCYREREILNERIIGLCGETAFHKDNKGTITASYKT